MKSLLKYLSNWFVAAIMLVAITFPLVEQSFSFADSDESESSMAPDANGPKDPTGHVTFPINGVHVRDTIGIRGTVHDNDIKSYKVLVTTKIADNIKCKENTATDNRIVYNTNFIPTDNLNDEVLTNFDTTTVNDGQYYVYLCVRDDAHPKHQIKVNNGPDGFIVDNTAPIINAPDVTAFTNVLLGTVVNYNVTASDAIDGNIPVNCLPASGSFFPVGVTPVHCTATDSAGNTSSADFNVTVILSDAPPVLNLPANISGVQATGSTGAVVNFTATATDAIDGPVPVTCSPISGSMFAIGTTTVNCSATDNASQTSNGSFTITVVDTLPPTLTLPANITNVQATGPGGASVSYVASATDIVDGPLPITCAPTSGSMFGIGTTTVNCSSTDSHGNTANGSFTVQVVDTIAPIISATPGNFTIEATSAAGAVANYINPVATDIVDGSVPVSCVPPSGSTFPLGVTTVTCTATDSHGNTSTTSFTISVVDSTPPFLSIQNPVSNSFVRGLINVRATASDPQTGISGVTFQVVGQTGNINMPLFSALTNQYRYTDFDTTTLPDGSYDFSFTATNNNANTSTFLSTNVTVDNTNPTAAVTSPVGGVHVNATIPINGTINDANISDYKVLVTNVNSEIACQDTTADPGVVFNTAWIPSGNLINAWLSDFDTSTVADGQYYVFLCARDQAGNRIRVSNSGSGGFVVDNTAPVIQNTPLPDVTAEATGPGGAIVNYATPTAIDAIEGPVPVVCVPASGSLFSITTTLVTCTASDSLGNSSQATFNVIVVDTTPPTILGTPADITAEATGPAGAVVNYTNPTANDIVDGPVPVTCAPASGSTFGITTTIVTCIATDSHGNTASTTFTVTVVDTTPPTIVGTPADMTIEATGPGGAVVIYIDPTATDIVDGSVPVTCAPPAGSTFPLGVTTVTCSATDAHGNTSTTTFTITIVDTTAPVLALPANIVGVQATGPGGTTVNFVATATDIVDGIVPVTCVPAAGSTFPIATTTVNCSSTDSHGNTANGSFTVQVVDTIAPVIAPHANITASTTNPAGISVSYSNPSATDIVDGSVSVTCSPASGSIFSIGVTTVTCSATDSRGNTSQSNFTVTVNFVPDSNANNATTGGVGNDDNASTDEEVGVLNKDGDSGKVKTSDEQNNKSDNKKDNDQGSIFNWWWWILLLIIGGFAGYSFGKYKKDRD